MYLLDHQTVRRRRSDAGRSTAVVTVLETAVLALDTAAEVRHKGVAWQQCSGGQLVGSARVTKDLGELFF